MVEFGNIKLAFVIIVVYRPMVSIIGTHMLPKSTESVLGFY